MITVIILLCLAGTPRQDCTVLTADAVIEGPPSANELMCMRDGMAYLAGTVIETEGRYVKVLCRRPNAGNVG